MKLSALAFAALLLAGLGAAAPASALEVERKYKPMFERALHTGTSFEELFGKLMLGFVFKEYSDGHISAKLNGDTRNTTFEILNYKVQPWWVTWAETVESGYRNGYFKGDITLERFSHEVTTRYSDEGNRITISVPVYVVLSEFYAGISGLEIIDKEFLHDILIESSDLPITIDKGDIRQIQVRMGEDIAGGLENIKEIMIVIRAESINGVPLGNLRKDGDTKHWSNP